MSSLEERIAIAETKIDSVADALRDIKFEVHDVNKYLRNELIQQIKEEKTHRYGEMTKRSKLQLWGAVGVSTVSLIITLIATIH